MSKGEKDKIIIIGCGRFGSTIAKTLSEKNKNVIIVDIEQSNFRKLSSSYGGLTKEGDGMDLDVLENIGIKNADIVIASTDDDDTNIMIAQIAKEIYRIDDVVARIYDNSKIITCERMNIITICPTDLAILEFKKNVLNQEES